MYTVSIHEPFQIPCVSKMTGITWEKLLRDFIENTRILERWTFEVEGEQPSFEDSHIDIDINNECESHRRFCNACGEFNWGPNGKPKVSTYTYTKGFMN